MERALVIGSEGNIGKPLVRHLRGLGIAVHESDLRPAWRADYTVADINSPVDLLGAFDCEPDVVFMLAGMVSRVTCEQSGALAVQTNLAGLQNVIDLTKRAGAKLVYMSTSEVYGPNLEVMDEASQPDPNNRYGLTKWLGEKLVEYEVVQHGLRAVTLRPFMMYDELEDLGDHRSAMIRFATNLAEGRPIEVHRGTARGWLHASDAVRAIAAAAELDRYSVINVGHPDVRDIAELATMVLRELDADPALVTEVDLPGRMTSQKRPTLDRMRTLLGVTPVVSLEEGVARVCATARARVEAQAPAVPKLRPVAA